MLVGLIILAIFAAFFIFLNSMMQIFLAIKALRSKKATTPRSTNGALIPNVLVQLPIYNEQYVVERLLCSASKLDYPRDKIIIQLLDDSTDQTSQIVSAVIDDLKSLGGHPIYHVKRQNREGFKAGALGYGMDLTKSELIAIFDADFIIAPDFLRRVVPEFADPAVGLVQTRWGHINANYNLLTNLMAIALDNHFSVEHAGKQKVGAFINFNGTAGIWRREAIEQAGGWSPDSLTEDLDLSFRAQFKGWKAIYLDDVETLSELPAALSELRSQQFRWTKGAAEAGKKNLINLWRCNAGLPAKVIGSLQLTNSILFPALFLIGGILLTFHFVGTAGFGNAFLGIGLVLCLSGVATTAAFAIGQWLRGRRSLLEIVRAVWRAQLFIIFSTGFVVQNSLAAVLGWIGKKSEFVRTKKSGVTTSSKGAVSDNSNTPHRRLSKFLPIELALAVVFLWAVVDEMHRYDSSYMMIAILLSFSMGFSLMTAFGVEEMLKNHSV